MANYLYNGIELPPLPVRDETVLPFAAIGKPGFVEPPEGEKYLFFCSEQINYTTLVGALLPTKGKGYVYKYTKEAGAWEKYDDWGFPDSTFPTSECSITRVDWSNYNILNTDGTLYLAASDPIPILAPVIDPLSMWLGWKAGNWVARQRGKAKQPVAYLYNGVRLPGLPEWDKTVYPYALIRYEEVWDLYGNSAYQVCFLSSAAHYAISADNPNIAYVEGADIGRLMYICEFPRGSTPPDVWEYQNKLSGKFGVNASSVIWADYDILNTADSTVYLSASDPVPVYE